MTANTGTAALAERGGRKSSKNGTGSPHSDCRRPTGQFPRPTIRAAPSAERRATLAHTVGLRRRSTALVQMCPSPASCTTDQAACSNRHDLARRPRLAHVTFAARRGSQRGGEGINGPPMPGGKEWVSGVHVDTHASTCSANAGSAPRAERPDFLLVEGRTSRTPRALRRAGWGQLALSPLASWSLR